MIIKLHCTLSKFATTCAKNNLKMYNSADQPATIDPTEQRFTNATINNKPQRRIIGHRG